MPVIALAVSAYFAHHSVDGRFGSVARVDLERQLAEAEASLNDLRQTKKRLEIRVALLRPGTIERDTLDEYARRELGLVGSNDALVLTPPPIVVQY